MSSSTGTHAGVVVTGTGSDIAGNMAVVADLTPANAGPVASELVRVAVSHVGVNPVDHKMIAYDFFLDGVKDGAAQVIGCDFVGTVTEVGAGVESGVAVGDVVMGYQPIDMACGAFQAVVDAPWWTVLKVPDGLEPAAAASVPVAVFTAAMAVFKDQAAAGPGHELAAGSVTDGSHFLVWGGSSSVGQAAIQLLSAVGFSVIAVASASQHDRLKELGAAVTIDYHDDDCEAQITAALGGSQLKYAFDTISPDTAAVCAKLCAGDAPAFVSGITSTPSGDAPDNVTFVHTLIATMGKNDELVQWAKSAHGAISELVASLPIKPNNITMVGEGWAAVIDGVVQLQGGVKATKLVIKVD